MADEQNPAHEATLNRRALLGYGTSLGLGTALGACQSGPAPGVSMAPDPDRSGGSAAQAGSAPEARARTNGDDPVLELVRLGAPPWPTFDPFLFCVHHRDTYPAGNAQLGPSAPLGGRNIGQDFANIDGWNMYHGDVVPGFPRHPHRGFETVTVTRRGYVDHSDSLGATARYGEGDVQWMTAGSGIVHAEMFPLLDERASNQAELFQIWLNLPSRSKFAKPHFSMFWKSQIPEQTLLDAAGRATRVTVIAGSLAGVSAPAPPPDSWASRADTDVSIWSIRMQPGASWHLSPSRAGIARTLYFFAGKSLRVAGRDVAEGTAIRVREQASLTLEGGENEAELLLLQGRPIGEPVVQHGPFVMNQRSEIERAVRDYHDTQFGGWPWRGSGPVHAKDSGRFAIHADGRKERAT